MRLRAALRDQARSCAALGSPFTARLLALAARNLVPGTPLADRLLDWPGDISSAGASVSLRLAGSLHGLVLSGQAPGLARCYPPNRAPGDDTLWAEVARAFEDHAGRIEAWLDRPPQTNEVGRGAVLIALGHWLAARLGLPLKLSELGASAGLNLMWDRYALELPGARLGPAQAALTLAPEWTGPPPPAAAPRIIDRRGADLTPLDPRDPEDALRLQAYVWPDQPQRMARTRAAIAAAEATVDAADAADWLQARLAAPSPGCLHLICHTVAWQYFSPETQARAAALIEAAGARATDATPLAWFGMEADAQRRGAALTLRLWPGGDSHDLGRADFHGRWIEWRAEIPF